MNINYYDMIKRQGLLYLYFLISILPVNGKNIVIQNLNERYGLTRNMVNCMCMFQDSKGFLWFGMANGLYKFDLTSFTYHSLQKNKINGFPEADIRAISEYAPGMLLIGTYNKGLLIYNTNTEKYDSINCCAPVNISKLYVHCIHIDKTGIIWIGTFNGLFAIKYSGKQLNQFEFLFRFDKSNTKLAGNEFVGITETKDGLIWFLTLSDIGFINPATRQIQSYSTYGANSSFSFIDDKTILIGCFDSGLKMFNTVSNKLTKFLVNGINETSKVRFVYKDKLSNIWLSISNVGLMLLEGDIYNPDITLISNKNPDYAELNSNVIYQINESRDGALWICNEVGVNMIYLKDNYFNSFSCKALVQSSELTLGIRSLLNSGEGFIWTGTVGGGLKQFHLDSRKFNDVLLINSGKTIGKNIQSIISDHNGNIWIGTEGEGVIKFIPDKNSSFTTGKTVNYRIYPQSFPKNSLLNDYVMCLLEDRTGNIWIGTWYGLSLFEASELGKPNQNNAVIKNFLNNPSDKSSISNNIVMSLLEDKAGNIWAGTQEGINKIVKTHNGYKFEHDYIDSNGTPLTEKKILVLYQSKKGTLWFSTQDGGICTLNAETGIFTEYNSATGFIDHIVNSISEDANGILWLGTNNGLCRFDPSSRSFDVYTTHDGLVSDNFFFGSSCKDDHFLYFGGNNGITVFNPNEVVPEKFIPNLVFTDLKLFNKPVIINHYDAPLKHHISNVTSLILKYNQNYLTLSFAALNYKHYKDVHYSCILEGMESSWNYLGKEHKVTYNNLAPGNYLFRVKAFSSNDYHNFSEISLPITIKPPFWKTLWAYLLYALVIISILFEVYRFILNKEKQKNALALERMNAKRIHEMDLMKLRFFTNISHEFRTPLTLISAPLETLIKENPEPEKARNYYQLMLKNVQRLKRLIDQLLDLRKIEEGFLKIEWTHGDIIEFIEKIFNTFQNYAEKRNIYFTFKTGIQRLQTYFDPDKIDKVLFNLLSNAFKYTPDYGTIALKLQLKKPEEIPDKGLNEEYLEIKITDSGIGIPKESMDKLFHPFQQVNSNKPIGSATTGIGLALTKELVELHNGFISVESEVNKGSSFTVYLPVYYNNPQKITQSDDQPNHGEWVSMELQVDKSSGQIQEEKVKPSGSKPLILLVEDNTELRSFLRDELKTSFRIIESVNGQDGFAQATEKIPDLVISDIMMDKLNGIELCKKLKTDERTSHIPIILLTARHSEEVKLNGFETGADDYITKPFNMALLISRIRNLIDQRRKLRTIFSKRNNFDLKAISNKTDSRFLEKLNMIIEKNLSNPDFTPSMLASSMALSRMQLYRKVSALTNQTVYNYIRTMRLNKAAQLLVTTDMQIAEVAFSVGFSEPSHFTKCFIRQFRQTPSHFARANQQ